MREYPDTKLIILDTLQKVREASKDYSYSSDYELMNKLKRFADIHGVCVLAVHHTRSRARKTALRPSPAPRDFSAVLMARC